MVGAEAQGGRGQLPQLATQALQELLLHQVELVGPDGVDALDGHGAGALGNRGRHLRKMLPDHPLPGDLHGCQPGPRRGAVAGGADRRRGGARDTAATHAAAALSIGGGGIRTMEASARGGTDSSDAAVIRT